MARNGRLIVLANEEDDEMVDVVAGKYPIIQVPRVDDALQVRVAAAARAAGWLGRLRPCSWLEAHGATVQLAAALVEPTQPCSDPTTAARTP